jgi:hypothetical protein
MIITLDGVTLFDEQGLRIEVGGPTRACVERTVSGLDGVASIDLGQRARVIRQSGELRASSQAAMRTRIDSICGFIDGQTHTLQTSDGREFRNVRMDTFKRNEERLGGLGITIEYEIVYTQLGA